MLEEYKFAVIFKLSVSNDLKTSSSFTWNSSHSKKDNTPNVLSNILVLSVQLIHMIFLMKSYLFFYYIYEELLGYCEENKLNPLSICVFVLIYNLPITLKEF